MSCFENTAPSRRFKDKKKLSYLKNGSNKIEIIRFLKKKFNCYNENKVQYTYNSIYFEQLK